VARERFVDGYLAALLARASKLISAEFHEVVRAGGLPVAEWRILASLAGGEPVPVGRLAQIVLAPQPTVTRQIDRMAAKGLVERVAHATDRRLTLARITPQGEALAQGLIERARAHERRVLAPFGRERAALLKMVLKEMIEQHQRPSAED
jgi:DNA-binding MarR family transcriptional regulator